MTWITSFLEKQGESDAVGREIFSGMQSLFLDAIPGLVSSLFKLSFDPHPGFNAVGMRSSAFLWHLGKHEKTSLLFSTSLHPCFFHDGVRI